MKAYITEVPFGSFTIEGLMDVEGNYYISSQQANDKLSFSAQPTDAARAIKRSLGKEFKHSRLRVEGIKTEVSAMPLSSFEVLLAKLDRAGNKEAQHLRDALAGLSLHQLFSDAFNVRLNKERRQRQLAERLTGIHKRRDVTDAIRDYWLRTFNGKAPGKVYANFTCEVYRRLGIPYNGTPVRDTLCVDDLKRLSQAEDTLAMLIDRKNMEPQEAITWLFS